MNSEKINENNESMFFSRLCGDFLVWVWLSRHGTSQCFLNQDLILMFSNITGTICITCMLFFVPSALLRIQFSDVLFFGVTSHHNSLGLVIGKKTGVDVGA